MDAFGLAREHGATVSELSTDSRTGALGLYEKVGMRPTATWVNRAVAPDLTARAPVRGRGPRGSCPSRDHRRAGAGSPPVRVKTADSTTIPAATAAMTWVLARRARLRARRGECGAG